MKTGHKFENIMHVHVPYYVNKRVESENFAIFPLEVIECSLRQIATIQRITYNRFEICRIVFSKGSLLTLTFRIMYCKDSGFILFR